MYSGWPMVCCIKEQHLVFLKRSESPHFVFTNKLTESSATNVSGIINIYAGRLQPQMQIRPQMKPYELLEGIVTDQDQDLNARSTPGDRGT